MISIIKCPTQRISVRARTKSIISLKVRGQAMVADKFASQALTFNLQLSAKLSQNIQKEYNALVKVVARVPDRTAQRIPFTGGVISVAELIGYQIGWGKRVIDWYEAGIRQKKIVMPGDGFDNWNYTNIAQHFYKSYQYDAAKQQDRVFYDTTYKIIEIVEKANQEGNLETAGEWEWQKLQSGKYWPLSKWVQVNTVAPFKRATTEIKKMVDI